MFRRSEASDTRQEKIAERFRALWELLCPTEDAVENKFRRLMRDQVRDALDRGKPNISVDGQMEFVANTFAVEHIIAETETTQILALRHRDIGTLHALKCARVQAYADPIAKSLLLREASIGLTFDNPHIVRTQMLLRLEDGRPAILMERGGPSLSQFVRDEPLSEQRVLQVLQSLLAGLDTLHNRGLVHGDISPANLLKDLDDSRCWKLCDLGICRPEGESVPTDDLAQAGTQTFQSPEQAAGEPMNRRSDLYSTGRLMDWMIAHLSQSAPISNDLMKLASHLTRDDPEDRPADVSTCLARLSDLV